MSNKLFIQYIFKYFIGLKKSNKLILENKLSVYAKSYRCDITRLLQCKKKQGYDANLKFNIVDT